MATDLLDEILHKGLNLNASDIHLEPREEFVRIRFRVDGLLQDDKPLHKNRQASLISRVKVLANLDIAETRLPQDGRTTFKHLDLRISAIPTIHGEKLVIRLLNRRSALMPLEALGMTPEILADYQQLITRPHGLILITGPTGSGKTTTLYATLSQLNNKEKNIVTVEDPVEYQLPGINQIQVNPAIGLTFAHCLRSILRQDPDIIMLGEIRDSESAQIGVQAALTGHLVFSTLHTKDAQSAVTRLEDLGIKRFLIESTLLGVMAQQLTRQTTGGRIGSFDLWLNRLPHQLRQDQPLPLPRPASLHQH